MGQVRQEARGSTAMKYLITGAASFVGTNLEDELFATNSFVRLIRSSIG
jgi:nucleoside-diphosphate-sugar epimerase